GDGVGGGERPPAPGPGPGPPRGPRGRRGHPQAVPPGSRAAEPVPGAVRTTVGDPDNAMPIDPSKWTLKTQEVVSAAVTAARTASNPEVIPEHLLSAMLGQEGTVVLPVLDKLGVAPLSLRNKVNDALAKLSKAYGSEAEMG